MRWRTRWILPWWGGVVGGVAVAAASSWLLVRATIPFRNGFDLLQVPQLRSGVLLLIAAGAVVGLAAFTPRLHPLVPGIPTVWFAMVFGPVMFRAGELPSWYPEWISRQFRLVQSTSAPFVIVGVLAVATVASLLEVPQPTTRTPQPEGHRDGYRRVDTT